VINLLRYADERSKPPFVTASLLVLLLIGFVDYITGFQIFFSVFYLLEVGLAAWFVSGRFGLIMSFLSVAVWIGGDMAAGARYSSPLIPIWNALILLVFYFIVVWLLRGFRALHRDLEARVRQRTQELTREIGERQRLEKEILTISEREQRRIAHDLHDNLCQHLTATALAGQVLGERLVAKGLPEAADATKVVELVEQGIRLARSFARGLYPVEMEAEGLMAAFQELADNINGSARTKCYFECQSPVLVHDNAVAAHLYRIAQEAVNNAMRHGKARRIGISLAERKGRGTLAIEDDGAGVPDQIPATNGLGIRIMAYRASMIGGEFAIEPAPTGGTIVTCSFPANPASTPKES
jgi:signal transduction histidine kinase